MWKFVLADCCTHSGNILNEDVTDNLRRELFHKPIWRVGRQRYVYWSPISVKVFLLFLT